MGGASSFAGRRSYGLAVNVAECDQQELCVCQLSSGTVL